ncbi:hypothetical protein EV192_104259 [Actinocrispum wychmicini]|uniref:Uncharacterized protein n=2 Tax=Actinocrispum wychmicini TaxID=1213861 RepID=A0A4R2JKR0_9PSEU|nr:hypothetical protein EV192_104259 [Actinocrispum wychmicini]
MTRLLARLVAPVVVVSVGGCDKTTSGTAVGGASTSVATTTTSATTSQAQTSLTITPTSSSANDVPDADSLGPFGWRPPAPGVDPILIGMDAKAAAATGVFTKTPAPKDGCAEWPAEPGMSIETVYVSRTIGVAAIVARTGPKIHTPEGVRIGMTAAKVHTAYPAFKVANTQSEGVLIPPPANSKARYRFTFDDSGKLDYLALESISQDCYG